MDNLSPWWPRSAGDAATTTSTTGIRSGLPVTVRPPLSCPSTDWTLRRGLWPRRACAWHSVRPGSSGITRPGNLTAMGNSALLQAGCRHRPYGRLVRAWLADDLAVVDVAAALSKSEGTTVLAEDLISYARHDLILDIDLVVANPEISGEGIAEQLAEGAVLPMFGMPSRVRDLIHGLDQKRKRPLSIDRDLDLAITEFAPGSQRTKDKAIHEPIGLRRLLFHAADGLNRLVESRSRDEGGWRGAATASSPVPTHKMLVRCSRLGPSQRKSVAQNATALTTRNRRSQSVRLRCLLPLERTCGGG